MQQLAETIGSPFSLPDALNVLTAGAVDAIPGADFASISVRHSDGRLETLAATDSKVNDLDAHQYELKEGPCYQAVTTGETFLVGFDLAHDPRWPGYGPIAARFGLHAQLAALLTENGYGSRSALNVYAAQPHVFNHDSIQIAEMFASHSAVAMGFVHTVENLAAAITTRQVIGQAIGVVMERYQLDEDRAFDFLVRTSSTSNVKLRDVAAEVVMGLNNRNKPQRPR